MQQRGVSSGEGKQRGNIGERKSIEGAHQQKKEIKRNGKINSIIMA